MGVLGKTVQSAPKMKRFPAKSCFNVLTSFATCSLLPSKIVPFRYNPPITGRLNNRSQSFRLNGLPFTSMGALTICPGYEVKRVKSS